jgi:predicted ribosomally synthesized peptide with nif11-like leader
MVKNKILESVKGFLVKLIKDEDFRTQLMSDKVEDIKKFMADGGYKFSQDEFETAAIKILELKELGEFEDLTEEELVGAVGGFSSWKPWSERFKPHKLNLSITKPLLILKPIDPVPAIAEYGVIMPREEVAHIQHPQIDTSSELKG